MSTINPGQKICPYPFARMELSSSAKFVPCCESWLTESYFKLDHNQGDWNSEAALKLRQSILDGTYSFCKTEICHPVLTDPRWPSSDLVSEAPISEANREAILKGQVQLPQGPTSYSLINDPRCNLACPSCRKQKIIAIDSSTENSIARADQLIEDSKETLEVLKLSGDGELFFSPWLKSIVKRLNPKDFHRFRFINVLSNGTLFNQKSYNLLLPGSRYIKSISISVDAGNKETYQKVRGGPWEQLVENLHWMGDQKDKGVFSYFQLNFTLRKANYQSIPEFINLGRQVQASNVKITPLFDYPHSAITNYAAEAIHRPEHPDFHKLVKLWQDHVAQDSFVRWRLPGN